MELSYIHRCSLNGKPWTACKRWNPTTANAIEISNETDKRRKLQKGCQQQFDYCDMSTAVWLPWRGNTCKQNPNLSGYNWLDAKQIHNAWPHRHVHDIHLLMACLDVLDEDILGWKGFACACYINAMKFGQVLECWALTLGNCCHHRLVVFKTLENKARVNHTLTNS